MRAFVGRTGGLFVIAGLLVLVGAGRTAGQEAVLNVTEPDSVGLEALEARALMELYAPATPARILDIGRLQLSRGFLELRLGTAEAVADWPRVFSIFLFGRNVEVQRDTVLATPEGGVTVLGRTEDEGSVTLSVQGTAVYGTIELPEDLYQIHSQDERLHVLRLDPATYPDEEEPVPFADEEAPDEEAADDEAADEEAPPDSIPAPEEDAQGEVRLDVLVLYTSEAARLSGIDQAVRSAEAEANEVLREQGITVRLFVRIQELQGFSEDSLHRLKQNLVRLVFLPDALQARRDAQADMVSLWVSQGMDETASRKSCGIAGVMESMSSDSARWTFSVVPRGCTSKPRLSFLHELMHNLGLHHDWDVHNVPTVQPYAHGYVDLASRSYSIMGYRQACVRENLKCSRVPRFSEGGTFGVPHDDSNRPADNRRVILEVAPLAATFSDIWESRIHW